MGNENGICTPYFAQVYRDNLKAKLSGWNLLTGLSSIKMNMIFYVAYSADARQDLKDIYEYIAYELLVPETAAGQWLHCSER